MKNLFLICVLFVTISCAPHTPVPFVEDPDLSPPEVVTMELADAKTLIVTFNEPVENLDSQILGSEGLGVITGELVAEDRASFSFEHAADPGAESFLEAQVEDASGNNLRFIGRFYGLNENLPALVLNEITTQGSGNHPDLVEILVIESGDMAGVALYEGIPENWEQRIIFPPLQVAAGDFIVVHFKPDGIAAEQDELTDMSASGGKNATDTAWDFWVPEGSGLSGNNGVIALTKNPMGGYIDVFLYSNRTSSSDERYRGFGSTKVMERADAVAAAGAWVYAGEAVAPEDAVDPEDSTATRSMSRGSDTADSNSKADWHITPTSGISPGAANTDEVYQP
jgi:hypothetical protein